MRILFFVIIYITFWISLGCDHICDDPKKGPVLGGIDFVQSRKVFESGLGFDVLPILGTSNFTALVGQYEFWFQNQDNLESFNSNPKNYLPQLGGYCSWGLTGSDIHVDDASGYCLAGSCTNSTNGFSYLISESTLQNFWYLKLEAKYDMEKNVDANIKAAKRNFDAILAENNTPYCFNTNMIRTCK